MGEYDPMPGLKIKRDEKSSSIHYSRLMWGNGRKNMEKEEKDSFWTWTYWWQSLIITARVLTILK